MGGAKQRGPSPADMWGGLGDIAGALSPFIPAAGIVEGVGGTFKEGASDVANPFGLLGGISKTLGGMASIGAQADELLPDVFGGMGNAAGIITGAMDALNSDKSAADRVVGGLDAGANALSLTGTFGGASLTGAGVGGASSLLTSGAGAALTAGGAASAAAAGGVLAAGVGGYKVGSLLANAADSEYGRSSFWGHDQYTGRERTGYDWAADTALAADQSMKDWSGSETLGTIAGGATALGTGLVAGIGGAAMAGWNWLTE